MKTRDLLKLILRPVFFIVKDPGIKNAPMMILDVTPTFRHAKKAALAQKGTFVLIGFKVRQ